MTFKADKIYIAKLLEEIGEGKKFIIPEYQRSYRWEIDECETLWNDIVGVFDKKDDDNEDSGYFLGSIVVYKNDKKEFEIIDGQQRITTLTLLFRAFYEWLRGEGKEKETYPIDFGKCIWDFDRDNGLQFSKNHLDSRVITDSNNKVLKEILGDPENLNIDSLRKNQSNYAKNFLFFYEKIKEFRTERAGAQTKFYNFLLGKNLFILFINCDSKTSAMTIFNTLNSRGLPLANADILKGYIYKNKEDEQSKKEFTNIWKEIESKIEDTNLILDFLFIQYMHIIRAENGNTETTVPSVVDFFTKNKFYGCKEGWLYKKETMPFIANLTDFWINPKSYLSDKSSKYISILNLFQNDAWKSFVSYLVWRNKKYLDSRNEFSKEFDEYLPKLIKLITLALLNKNVDSNIIKEISFKMSANLCKNEDKEIKKYYMPRKDIALEDFKKIMDSRKIKYILFLYAYIYSDFKEEIEDPSTLQIEHILPKQWQNANFNGWNSETHEEYIEQIGNKILIDKKTNTKCSDNFFAQKQKNYKDSTRNKIREIKDLGNRTKNIWDKEDIKNRNDEIYNRLKRFLED